MQDVAWILGLLTGVTLLAAIARRVSIPYPTLMVLGGACVGLLPGLPEIRLDPDLVLVAFLPPLLYSAAWGLPWNEFRERLRPITFLAVGLPLATTVAVAFVAHALVPGIPWPAAFVLGALVSPPDAVAATSIMKIVQVPRTVVVVLEGESLLNDATGLVAYRLAVAAVVTGIFSWQDAGSYFVWVVITGIGVGLIVGRVVAWMHRRLDDGNIETAVTLLTPFAAYVIAELLHASGVLATVAAGLYMRRRAPVLFSSAMRLQATAVWDLVVFMLNGLAFVLIGLELRTIVKGIVNESLSEILTWAFWVLTTVVIVRLVGVIPSAFAGHLLSRKVREREPSPPWRAVLVVGWTGMRGVVSLAAALALPQTIKGGSPFPFRDLIIFMTFCVIFGTLVGQSLTLPWLIRKLKIKIPKTSAEEEADARLDIISAAIRHLEASSKLNEETIAEVGHVRRHFEVQATQALASIAEDHPDFHLPIAACQSLHNGALNAQRERLGKLRDSLSYDTEILNRLEREIDLEETQLRSQDYRKSRK